MQQTVQLRLANWQRALTHTILVAVLLLAGALPALHQHEVEGEGESHCHDRGRPATTHLETAKLAHHEPCGLCAMHLSLIRPGRPGTAFVDVLVADNLSEGRQTVPPGLPGRHGASRAPPSA